MRSCAQHILLFSLLATSALAQEALPPPALLNAPDAQTQTIKPEPNPIAQGFAGEPNTATLATEAKSDFREALISAYNTNPRLKAEREALKAIDEEVAVAASGFRPTAIAGYEKGRERIRNTAVPGWDYGEVTSKGLTVEQPIFNGGETFAQYRAASARAKAGRAQLLGVEQQVLFDAVNAYSDVVEKQSVLELSRSNVDVLKRQQEATQARFDVGELTRTDTSQADARLATAEATMRQAEGDLKASLATFRRVVGFMPQVLAIPNDPPPLPASAQEATDQALAANPDLLAAKQVEKATGQDVNARLGTLLPDVSLIGSMNRLDSTAGRFPGNNDSDSVTLNVSIPLYQSGAEYARIRAAKNLSQQAKYNTMDTNNAVIENVTRAFENYQTALAVITSTESSVKAAEVALEGVRQENEFGVRTILDVLDAEQEAFNNRVNLVRAQRVKTVQAYQLLAVLGRLTAEGLQLPVETYNPKDHYNTVKWLPIGF